MKWIKRKTLECYVVPTFLFILLILPHLFFFNNYYVDIERLYVEAAEEIADNGTGAGLSEYYYYIANPILTSLFLSVSYKVFWQSPVVSRITIFLFSIAFLFFFYFYIRKKLGFATATVSSLLVISNPLFIVYSQYVHTDVPFMIFSSSALLLLLFGVRFRNKILSSVLFGVSLATKYITMILAPVVFLNSVMESGVLKRFMHRRAGSWKRLWDVIRFNLWYFILAIVVALPVIVIVFFFQDWIFSSFLGDTHAFNFKLVVIHFFAYLLWLGLFIGPFFLLVLYDLWNKMNKKYFMLLFSCLFLFTLAVSFALPISALNQYETQYGEMNLSWVEEIVPPFILYPAFFLILFVAEVFIASMFLDFIKNKMPNIRDFFFWIVLPLVFMSFTRAANRYMLALLIPLSLYFSFVSEKVYSRKTKWFVIAVVVLQVLIFLAVGTFSNYYLHQRGIEALAALAVA